MLKENETATMNIVEKLRAYSPVITAVSCVLILIFIAVAVFGMLGTLSRANSALDAMNDALAVVNDSKDAITDAGEMVKRLNEVSKEIEEADIPGLVGDLTSFVADAQDIFSRLDETATDTLSGSKDALDKLSKIDIDSLNTTIESFTAIVEPLAKLLKPW